MSSRSSSNHPQRTRTPEKPHKFVDPPETPKFDVSNVFQAINGWKLGRAIKFLENVQNKVEAVPMRRYAGGTGRASQGTSTTIYGNVMVMAGQY